jgi:hypothetical protein
MTLDATPRFTVNSALSRVEYLLFWNWTSPQVSAFSGMKRPLLPRNPSAFITEATLRSRAA